MPRLRSRHTRKGVALAAVRLAWGGALVVAPGRVIGWLGGADTADSRAIERVLGGRHLIQGAVELGWWPRWRRLGVAVDGLHAASGVALAVKDRRWRRAAGLDAVITTGFALAGATVG